MDKDKLAQYLVLQKEIADINFKINCCKDIVVTDITKGSNTEHPYQEIHIPITGVVENKQKRKLYRILKDRLEKARDIRLEIEDFISGIDDSLTRYIFEKRYIDGWSWVKISKALGSTHESYARMIHNRFLK
ncbi:hypothetical protein ABID14_000230 [Peptoniphilus olsenii]|uniref:Phage transcriptional regulator, RinA family n=1 Tax=Peptoniphilus olsenii TaxID=411570 RepID=A0ABV2J9M2_9FIRM